MRRSYLFGAAVICAALASGETQAAPWDTFMASLTGPWGKTTSAGEPLAEEIADKAGKTVTTRTSCPEAGLAGPKDMTGAEVWYDRNKNGRFGTYSSRTPTRLSELTFIRLEGADTAVFYFVAGKGRQGVTAITRLTPDRIVVRVTAAGTTTETYYARCKRVT